MRSTIQPTLIFVLAVFAALSIRSVDAQQLQLDFDRVENGVTLDFHPSSPAKMVTETYTVEVPYTENVPQNFTVQIPYTENVTQKYTVKIPYTETITGENGEEKEVQKTRTEQRERQVPVTRVRTETRTRMVPVTKTRTEKRTREVSAGENIATPFPPANASFAYVSGKEITLEQVKAISAEDTITILRLSDGQTLTELHRQTLNPDLIVMTIGPDTDEPAENADPEEDSASDEDRSDKDE